MSAPRRDKYTLVAPEQARAGDHYKFTPTDGAAPLFGKVVEVWPGGNLAQVRWRDGGTVWTYNRPPVGEVRFARKVTEGREGTSDQLSRSHPF